MRWQRIPDRWRRAASQALNEVSAYIRAMPYPPPLAPPQASSNVSVRRHARIATLGAAALLLAACGASPSSSGVPTPSLTPVPSPSPSPTSSVAPSEDAYGNVFCPASYWHPALALDRSSYTAGQTVNMTGTATNASSSACTPPSTYSFSVTPPDGKSRVVCFTGGAVAGTIAPGASESMPCAWRSSGAGIGQYTATVRFADAQGTSEGASELFSIG